MAETWAVKIEEEEKERLSQLIEQSGLTSKDFLGTMMTAYELTKAKDNMPLLTQDIDELQRITTRINSIFVNVGERIQNLLDSKDSEYVKQLQEKQTTISIMNEKNIELNQEADDNRQKILTLEATIDELNIKLLQEKDLREASQNLAEEYKKKVDIIESEIEEHKAIRETNTNLQSTISEQSKKISDLVIEKEKLQLEKDNLEKKVNEVNKEHEDELKELGDRLLFESDKEKLKLKEEYQEKLQVLQEQYNKKVQELLEKLENKDKEIKDHEQNLNNNDSNK